MVTDKPKGGALGEYSAGGGAARTFDDGQGAKLLRPENRLPAIAGTGDKAVEAIKDALIYAGIIAAS